MHVALQGLLWGVALGVVLVLVEYNFVKKAVQERAETTHRKPAFEEQDRKRIRQVANFSVLIPPAFALGAWLIWG